MNKLEGQKRSLDFSKAPAWTQALSVIRRLQSQGFEAVIAGGAVRDALLASAHLKEADLDIATNATPDEVEALFPKTVAVGKAFGVVRVIQEGHSIEVASFRKDGLYIDGRRPENVELSTMKEDAERRDFTINALFYDPIGQLLFDFVDGESDLKAKILRAVGDAQSRMSEDQLRRLRLIRFVSQLGFDVESKTLKSLSLQVEKIKTISLERITVEIEKMWLGEFLFKAIPLFIESGIAMQIHGNWQGVSLSKTKELDWPRRNPLEAWLHYFFCLKKFDNLEKNLNQVRLSREMQIQIVAAAKQYAQAQYFLKLRFGEQRKLMAKPGFSWVLDVALSQNENYLKLRELIQSKGELPQPLINGEDVMRVAAIQGIKLGQILQEIYFQQLESDWNDKSQAEKALQALLNKK